MVHYGKFYYHLEVFQEEIWEPQVSLEIAGLRLEVAVKGQIWFALKGVEEEFWLA
jgi:hypothetical protein